MRIVRSVLVLISCFLSATACWGGAVLIAEAHGNPLGILPRILLASGPFRSWVFPGAFLFAGVGLLGIWTLWVNLRQKSGFGFWTALEGLLLLGWVLFCPTPLWLHYLYGALALILIASGLSLQSLGALRSGSVGGRPTRC